MNINQLITLFIECREALQIRHWNTTSYAEHKAVGKFYDDLSDLLDSFVETYSGKYGRPLVGGIVNILDRDANSIADAVCQYACDGEKLVSEEDTDLLNILADIKGAANHTKYLLTLK